MIRTIVAGSLALLLTAGAVCAQGGDLPKGLQGVTIGGTYFLHYRAADTPNGNSNRFMVSRGYLTLKKAFGENFSSRITPDVHLAGNGDRAVRLKYIYGVCRLPGIAFITGPYLEFGLVHTPWLDFEEHINVYRIQGTMFMERSGLFNSADVGITVGGLFGGEIDDEFRQKVSSAYPGRYGSFAIGVYNGGGYHAVENNDNKVLQVRLTGRPLPDGALAGLQVSCLGIFGKGNLAGSTNQLPDYNVTALMLTWQASRCTLTGQYILGAGNASGSAATASTTGLEANSFNGYSLYGAFNIIAEWSLMGRYEVFDGDTDISGDAESRLIVGVSYELDKHNQLLADYEINTPEATGVDPSTAFKLSWGIDF